MIKKNTLLLLLLLIPFSIWSEEKKNKEGKSVSESYSANGLKQLEKFNFFAGFPAGSNRMYEEIRKEIQNELKQYGKSTTPDLIVISDNGKEAIDPTIFSGDASMKYRIKDVYSISGKKMGVVKASLAIEDQAFIDKTKVNTNVCIWKKSCFFLGSTEKDLKSLVKTSLIYLLEDFSSSYKEVNKEVPSFIYANY